MVEMYITLCLFLLFVCLFVCFFLPSFLPSSLTTCHIENLNLEEYAVSLGS